MRTEKKEFTSAEKKQLEMLDKKIERLQKKISIKRQEYDALTDELQKALDERYPERNAERIKNTLYAAYLKSDRTLNEIIEMIEDLDEYLERY